MKEARSGGEENKISCLLQQPRHKKLEENTNVQRELPLFFLLKGPSFIVPPFGGAQNPEDLRTAAHLLFVCVVVGMPIVVVLFGAAVALGDAAEGREGYHRLVPTTPPGLVLLANAPDLLRRSSSSQQNL